MWEVVQFPVQNTNQISQWELDAHFESEIEAAEAVQEEIVKNKGIIERAFPTWWMTHDEVVKYLANEREYVVNDVDRKVS